MFFCLFQICLKIIKSTLFKIIEKADLAVVVGIVLLCITDVKIRVQPNTWMKRVFRTDNVLL